VDLYLKKSSKVSSVIICVSAILLYIIVLTYFEPLFLGFRWQYDYVVIPMVMAIFCVLAKNRPDSIQNSLGFSVTLVLSGVILSELWKLGVSSGGMLAGCMPYSDSYAYLDGTLRFLNGEGLSIWTSRRPLATAWLSLSFFVTGENLKYALALITVLNSFALTCAVCEVRRHLGFLSGWLAHVLLFFCYRTFLGSTLSEQCGFFFGCMAFSMLWKTAFSDPKESQVRFLTGLFVLTIGLVARAGTFFALPAFVLWHSLRIGHGKKMFLKVFLTSCCVIALVFGYNGILLRVAGYPEAAFGNFAPALYGLLHGGTWTQVYSDYPELESLPDIESNQRIYALSIARLREQPVSLLKGALRAYRSFFISPLGAYSFVVSPLALSLDFHDFAVAQKNGSKEVMMAFLASGMEQKYYAATAFLWFLLSSLLAFAGLIRLIMTKSRYRGLVISAGIGILLSVPFLPPWDVPLMRVYITTMPFFIILPCIALSGMNALDERIERHDRGLWLEACVLLLCAVVMVFPLVLQLNQGRILARIPKAEYGAEIAKIIPGTVVTRKDWGILENFTSSIDLIADALKNDQLREYGTISGDVALGMVYLPREKVTSYAYWDAASGMAAGEWVEVREWPDKEGLYLRRLEQLQQ
jgi:hypothetical protein